MAIDVWRYLVSLPAAILLLLSVSTVKVSGPIALAFVMPNTKGPLALSLASAPQAYTKEPVLAPPKPVKEKLHTPEHKPKPKPTTKPLLRPVPEPVVEQKATGQPTKEVARSITEKLPVTQVSGANEPPAEEAVQESGVSSVSAASAPVWVDKPKFMARPKAPGYPGLARRRGMEGVVMIEVLFNRFGEQLSLEMVESSGFGLLDDAAIAAVRDWQFAAPSEGNRFKVRVPVRFSLN